MNTVTIRKLQQHDNAKIASVIRSVLIEYNVPKIGTAYADPQLDCMFETYSEPKSAYFVIEDRRKIIGGAGVGHLQNEAETICELQKMYFLPEARGKGLGMQMMAICLKTAKEFGYQKCYLETMPYMEDAQRLYKKTGFEYLRSPMGNTGHTSCPIWMIKEL